MKITGEQDVLRNLEKPALEQVRSGESLETKKKRLRQATEEFESFFVLHMLKAMRQTIPESGLLDEGLGKDIYTSLFDQELSKKMAGNSSQSLGEILYRSLEKHITAESSEAAPGRKADKTDRRITDEMRRSDSPVKIPAQVKTAPGTKTEKSAETIEPFQSSRPKITPDPVLGRYGRTIEKVSRENDVDPRLVYAVIMAESSGRPDAVSPKGAKGLMQLTDSTAEEMGVGDSLNPVDNIAGGTKYLRRLLDTYDGDLKLTLAAYNAGPGTVSKYNGVPPYAETQRYIEKVLETLNTSKNG